ncbi:hypothetical protein [Anabaenopsis elenkinii]|uniref:Uncharacterized protein n=1 Tax=Anabaenopsis elenkinii CCIBt3563 TaxID=2779889 RepID=A0A7S6RFA1_9CYAN|nr:hypothetical protein [Anabaenopsis elenkinii]QOV23841.1 hypothetical protein IM676_06055 [Anabaenopsis elenkinii CCIBt3563]
MRVWLACFLLLFAVAELFDWLKKFNLPLPIYILGGVFLAVASNYDKIIGSYFSDDSIEISSETSKLNSCNQTLTTPVDSTEQTETIFKIKQIKIKYTNTTGSKYG